MPGGRERDRRLEQGKRDFGALKDGHSFERRFHFKF